MKVYSILLALLIYGPTISGTARAESCTSDFSCGVGEMCAKEPYKITGTCVRKVDKYGATDYLSGPSTDSVGVGTEDSGTCMLSSECPAGYTCKTRPGSIRGLCTHY